MFFDFGMRKFDPRLPYSIYILLLAWSDVGGVWGLAIDLPLGVWGFILGFGVSFWGLAFHLGFGVSFWGLRSHFGVWGFISSF